MTKKLEVYKCNVCGNIVTVLHEGAGALVCCGQAMELKKEQTQDPEKGEKHLPVIEGKIVKVGSVEHPMEPNHYIEWIQATDKEKYCIKFLNPGDKPEVEFDFEPISAREYCNIHGLWEK